MSMSITLPKLSGSALKVIAIFSMVIDHCAYYLMDGNTVHYEVMRCLGRIAFPVFAFLVAEGFAHTRNRKIYFGQLLFFAVVSEIPWYLLNGADGTHNVMFTLALGVVALAVFEKLKRTVRFVSVPSFLSLGSPLGQVAIMSGGVFLSSSSSICWEQV